jgi:hypothetical protein
MSTFGLGVIGESLTCGWLGDAAGLVDGVWGGETGLEGRDTGGEELDTETGLNCGSWVYGRLVVNRGGGGTSTSRDMSCNNGTGNSLCFAYFKSIMHLSSV